jgi:hypothetical protein
MARLVVSATGPLTDPSAVGRSSELPMPQPDRPIRHACTSASARGPRAPNAVAERRRRGGRLGAANRHAGFAGHGQTEESSNARAQLMWSDAAEVSNTRRRSQPVRLRGASCDSGQAPEQDCHVPLAAGRASRRKVLSLTPTSPAPPSMACPAQRSTARRRAGQGHGAFRRTPDLRDRLTPSAGRVEPLPDPLETSAPAQGVTGLAQILQEVRLMPDQQEGQPMAATAMAVRSCVYLTSGRSSAALVQSSLCAASGRIALKEHRRWHPQGGAPLSRPRPPRVVAITQQQYRAGRWNGSMKGGM